MTRRTGVLVVVATTLSIVFAVKLLTRGSLTKAAYQLGDAVLHSDKNTIWTFVSENDRKLYNIDRSKFDRFWDTMMKPYASKMTQRKLAAASLNGIVVDIYNPSPPGSTRAQGVGFLVSGNQDAYTCPFFFSYCFVALSLQDFDSYDQKDFVKRRFTQMANWLRMNKHALHECGIDGFKTGSEKDFRTIDTLASDYEAFVKQISEKASQSNAPN